MSVAVRTFHAEAAAPTREAAFATFVEDHRDRSVRLAFRLLGGDAAAAEDVAQNAFLRAHRALGAFRGESTLDTWFYRILVREAERHRRWRAVRRLWHADPEEAPEPIDPSPPRDPALARAIVSALGRLTRSQREVFILVHLEGFTVVDAAGVVGKAVGTVKSHLHRALESLRRDLAGLIPDEERSA